MFFIFYILIFITILAASWQAFVRAFLDPSLIYLPLRSFFLAIRLNSESPFYNLPGWILANDAIKPFISFKIVNEVTFFILIIIFVSIFFKLLDLKQWFLSKAEAPSETNFKDLVKNLSFVVKSFFVTVKDAVSKKKVPHHATHTFMPKNIFEIDYSQITFLSLMLSFLAVFFFPGDSSDLFGYIARGAQQAIYDQNPFAELVSTIPNWQQDPFFANFLWSTNPSPYGPFFMLICKAIVNLSFGNFWLALGLFKLLNWFIFFLLVSLTYTILNDQNFSKYLFPSKNHEHIGKMKKVIYSLIALNPFLIIESVWNAHNDIFMAFFILFALYMLFKKSFNFAIIGITCATLIKYFSLVLVPIMLIYYVKFIMDKVSKEGKSISVYWENFPLWGILLSAGLSYYVFSFYDLTNMKLERISENMILSHKSLFDLFNSLYKYIAHQDLPLIMKEVFLGGFLAYLIYMVYKYFKSDKELDLFEYSFWILFALIFIASPKFHSWYLCTILPLMAICKPRLALVLSCTHLLSLTLIDQANILNFALMTAVPVMLYLKFLHHRDTSRI